MQNTISDEVLIHKGKRIVPYMSAEFLNKEVSRVASEISKDYQGQRPILVGVLNGAFMFMADLIRKIDKNMEVEMDFIKLSSYNGQESSGIVKALHGIKTDIKGRHVIIVEDIIETGITMQKVVEELKQLGPSSVKLASCFRKVGKQKVDIQVDYLATDVEDYFIIGYGLDWNEYGRGLESLYRVE